MFGLVSPGAPVHAHARPLAQQQQPGWTGTITYLETEEIEEYPRPSMKRTVNRRVEAQITIGPEGNTGSRRDTYRSVEETTSSGTDADCGPNRMTPVAYTQKFTRTFGIEASGEGKADLFVSLRADGTYQVMSGTPDATGPVKTSAQYEKRGGCHPAPTVSPGEDKRTLSGFLFQAEGRVDPEEPLELSGSVTRQAGPGRTITISWSLEWQRPECNCSGSRAAVPRDDSVAWQPVAMLQALGWLTALGARQEADEEASSEEGQATEGDAAEGQATEGEPRVTSVVTEGPFPGPEDPAVKRERYKDAARDGARRFFGDCAKSVQDIAKHMGHSLPTPANTQIQYMRDNWQKIDMDTASQLADQGILTVVGWPNPNGSGHTAVVVPGPGVVKEGKFWPNIAGGSLGNDRAKERANCPYSEGGLTIRGGFGKAKR